MVGQVQVLQSGAGRSRHIRRPNFPIAGTMRPFGHYPIMVHPVLPGETLKSAVTRWRVIGQPVTNPFAGAWLESWLWYVKLTDLDRDLGQMFVSDSFSTAGWTAGGDNARTFTKSGQIDWIANALNRCHDTFFLNQGETRRTIDGVPQVKLNQKSWYQNLMFRPAEVAVDVTDPLDTTGQLTAWQMLNQMNMTELTYERYLEQYGVQSMRLGVGNPEILRYTRSWVQPVSHVNPSTGAPSSAWVWSDELKAEKDKRFDEPGFILQTACIRPKMYSTEIVASMVGNLWGFTDWFPAYNLADPAAGVRVITTADTVFDPLLNASEATDDLLYDHRDLLNHGEQFVNDFTTMPYAWPRTTGMSLLAAANAEDVRGEYCASTDVDNLFVGSTSATRLCAYEGMTSLQIAGHVTDTTPLQR